MAAILSQTEADALMAVAKRRIDDSEWPFPEGGAKVRIPLVSLDGREEFLLDLRRGRIDVLNATYQERTRQVIPLVRIDLAGPPHRNPDDVLVPTPHLHEYREGAGLKWARPLPPQFSAPSDLSRTLDQFLGFCNIVEPPRIQRSLFI